MTFNIISLYKKTWPGNKFGVSFLHDSIHCEHCLKGKIHISRQLKNQTKIEGYNPPSVEDLTKSCFYQSHLKSFAEIKHNSIPESSFSTLGLKVTKSVAAKLNQGCVEKDIKNPLVNHYHKRSVLKSIKCPRKTNDCENKNVKKSSKAENQEPVHEGLHNNYFPPSKVPLVKENKGVKKQKIPNSKPISSSKLIETVKEPTKGTLKRKRWTLQKLKQSNLNYEDDLFENQKFCSFESIVEDNSDTEKYEGMRTPQINLSPVRDGSNTPTCNDCYSPGELFSHRKEAEEYIFRREKRRKMKLQDERSSSEPSPEKPINTDAYTIDILEKASKILNKVFKVKESEKESDEDEYFTDVSDNSD